VYFVELLYSSYLVTVLISQTYFCYVCGEFTPKSLAKSITPIAKKVYELYFGCKDGDQTQLGTTFMLQETFVVYM